MAALDAAIHVLNASKRLREGGEATQAIEFTSYVSRGAIGWVSQTGSAWMAGLSPVMTAGNGNFRKQQMLAENRKSLV